MRHVIRFIEYSLIGIFVGGMVLWIYHTIVLGNETVEWDHAFDFGILFGLFFTYLHRDDHPADDH